MHHRKNDSKLENFISLAKKAGHHRKQLLIAWYRGLRRLKRDLTPNDRLLSEYPN